MAAKYADVGSAEEILEKLRPLAAGRPAQMKSASA
jgi:hypothetical protein